MDERLQLAFEFARDIATQLLTLSSAFLALTITFTRDVALPPHTSARRWLLTAWVFQLASIFAGVWTLSTLTGALIQEHGGAVDASFLPLVRLPALVQVGTFTFGFVAVMIFGFRTIGVSGVQRSQPTADTDPVTSTPTVRANNRRRRK